MFRILFLIANSVVNNTDVPPIAFVTSMATLPLLQSHSASPPVTDITQEDDWPMPSSIGTISRDGIPPSPGILNVQGLRSASGVVASWFERPIPIPNPTDLSAVTPELAEILDKWETSSRDVKTAKIQVHRRVYNVIHEDEYRAEGELIFAAPGQISLAMKGNKINRRETSSRISKKGNPFHLKADRPEWRIWTASQLWLIDEEEKTFECVSVPENNDHRDSYPHPWFAGWVAGARYETWIPFLVDIRVAEIRQDWQLKLHRKNDGSILLIAQPRTALMKLVHSECRVLIDTKSWQTTAVKYFSPSRDFETVYDVHRREINVELPIDCFEPDLKARGYRQITHAKGIAE